MLRFRKNKLREIFSVSSIITILYYEFSKNFSFVGEKHNFWELVYVDKGEILISADSSEYLLKAGEMAFHKPNEFHNLFANGKIAPNVSVVSFECKSASMKFFENKIIFLNQNEKNILSQIIKEGHLAFEKLSDKPPISGMKRKINSPAGCEQMVKLYLELLLVELFRKKDTILKKKRYTTSPLQHIHQGLSENISSYLKLHINDNVTLSALSNHFGVSIPQIKKVFKSQTGKSILDYFISLKINEAKRLIREEDLNFTQISDKLGYSSVHYFSRIFKAKTGMSPTEYSLSVTM